MPEQVKNWRGGFWSLIVTQFQGAFNENGLKSLVFFLILAMHLKPAEENAKVFLLNVLFSAPFILFSMTGGYLADRFSKRSVTMGTKVFEMAVMLLAIAALAQGNVKLALVSVFLASTQAAIFGPSKYGLLPELLPQKLLSWGNGIIELGTFLAIIAGVVASGYMFEAFTRHEAISGAIFFACSVAGLASAYAIAKVPAADPQRAFRTNVLADLWSQVRLIRQDRVLWLAVAGNTYFWFFGALVQNDVVFYGERVLHLTSSNTGILLASVAIGIGVGSMAAGFLSGGKIEYGLIPLGAVGMTLVGFALSAHGISHRHVMILLASLGFAGGFFVVPINALIQHRPEERHKGGVIAAANLLSFVGIAIAGALYYVLTNSLHLTPAAIFFWAAAGTIAASIYVLWLLPDSLLRLLLWFATHTLYRMDIQGRENVPARGGALLAPNHGSIADAALVIASTDRPVRFLMFKEAYENPFVKPFAKILGVIPISSQQHPREMIHSLREATQALRNGDLVCIFPEGQMTRIGQMLPFRRGMERIMKGADAPIIPMNIDGIWGSIFSFSGGRFFWKLPRRIPYPVRVTLGKPMPPESTAQQVRQAVQELGVGAFERRKRYMKTLAGSFIQTARRHAFRFAMVDGRSPRLRFFSVLAKTVFLARRLSRHWRGQQMVGILLPPSVPGALVNFAALLMGKVPVNLNYTTSQETIASCAKQCELQTVVTSRLFLEKIHLQPLATAIFVEDLTEKPRWSEKIAAPLAAAFLPGSTVQKFVGAERVTQIDDIATIIFSSGSTGDPKGVVLTHYNVASNVEQLNQVFMLHSDDRILGILPFFHSFGFTATLALPMNVGIGVVYHPSPIDAHSIGALVSEHTVTMLLATPTFLQAYARRCAPEDFGSLRFVLAGAEKLPDRISQAFEDQFGIRPLEGYGCTECSPAVAVNTQDFRAAFFRQVGAKRGSIGHPLPGMGVRILDPETGEPVPLNQPGLLEVRGPNVMRGYLNRPEKTAEVLVDGWYNTGDIAALDEDGFIRITDRLSRFSKIGGEMVPHIKIEDKLHELAESAEQVFAVTSVPDERKGERIVVLHTLPEENLRQCLDKLSKSDLPALWKPKPDQFLHVEKLPYLGTGKLDLRRLRELALQMANQD